MVAYRHIDLNGIKIAYREAGRSRARKIVLLHGFPTSSHMYRELIPALADDYHVIALDYPGFGYSDSPDRATFSYTFDHIADVARRFLDAVGVERFSIFVQDYGAPVGFRLALAQPQSIEAIISQNGNAYEEGLSPAWEPIRQYWEKPTPENRENLRELLQHDFTKLQYVAGARDPELISPDTWTLDQHLLDRPGNAEIQLDLFYDYRNNLAQYPLWQAYFREHQPPVLVIWGRNDPFFGPAGALAYAKDLKDVDVHLINAGHFALEGNVDLYTFLINRFLKTRLGETMLGDG
jgi:pimeloyl-ACP methyl ester carboxylesterase